MLLIMLQFITLARLGAIAEAINFNNKELIKTVEFRFGAVVLIAKLVFNVVYERNGVAGSQFGTHGHTIDLFITTAGE